MTMVAIVGAGTLGGSIAHKLAGRDRVGEIRLIDEAAGVAAGKALDIQQSGAVEPFTTRVVAHHDLHAALGAAVVVVAGPGDGLDQEWSGEAGLTVLRRLEELNRRAVVICAGSSHRDLVEDGVAGTSLSRDRLIGSAPYAFQAALRAVVAVELQCSALDVSLAVLGVPPDSLVVPWSEASVRGAALLDLLSPSTLAELQRKVRRVWPPGPYTLAAAAARMCESLLMGTAVYGLPCFVVLDGELGVKGKAVAMTATLGASGVTGLLEPSLSAQERVQLDTAAQG